MRGDFWSRLLLVLLCLLPLVVLFLLPGQPAVLGAIWFWLLVAFTLLVVWRLLGLPSDSTSQQVSPEPRTVSADELPPGVSHVMQVRRATELNGVLMVRGHLQTTSENAYQQLQQALGDRFIPLLREDPEDGTLLIAMPKPVEQSAMERRPNPAINWILFALTLLTTTWAGAAHQGVNLLESPQQFLVGLPYAIGLMAILGVHELGHFFTARYHAIRVTPPYFIPVPFALGTFGAFIQMKSPTQTRTSLFDVAVAGPLAGLVIAIPALLIGLQHSQVIPADTQLQHEMLVSRNGTAVGSSILLAGIAKLALPDALAHGCTVRLSPLAFAGWLGLIVTALNLVPVGQLDGGHIVRAMFGNQVGSTIGTVAMWSLFLLAIFVWPGLLMWAVIVFFIAGRGVPPLDDVTPINRGRIWIGCAALLILVLILAPVPRPLMSELGIHCPYL